MSDRRTAPVDPHLVALTALPGMGPRRIRALLAGRTAAAAWAIAAGRTAAPDEVRARLGTGWARTLDAWRAAARAVDPPALADAHRQVGIGLVPGDADALPQALRDDPEGAAVLFHRGDLDRLHGPRVTIVGTRRATRYGVDLAVELGHDLARAGVRVVSGLALGIDGAAHRGALAAGAAPPVAVVGSGLDVVYPPRHRELWEQVAGRGVLLSEHPLGVEPARWHFPARNRLLAALGDVVVVVESGERGGSLTTVDEALARDVPVLAVPGSVRSRASVGTNALLVDGAAPCRGAHDVLELLGLVRPPATPTAEPPADLSGLLDAIGWEPIAFEALVLRTGCDVGPLATAVARLEADGWITSAGGWLERTARR